MKVFGIEVKSKGIVSQLVDLTVGSQRVPLPLFIIDGLRDGPTLCVTAGVHGCEYGSIEAAYRLSKYLKPQDLNGTVIILPVCNMPSFQKRTVYVGPIDNKNLNRVFPGDKEGSFSEILAYHIFDQAIYKANVYIDLHGGDLIEALVPFVSYPKSVNSDVQNRSKAIAQSFGLDLVVESAIAGSSIFSASEAGIPAIMAEAGGQGIWNDKIVDIHVSGVRAVMGQMDMLSEKPTILPSAKEEVHFPWLYSDYDGLFYPKVSIGDEVLKEECVGSICDYCGEILQTVHSPVNGTVLFLVTSLAINKGDPLMGMGEHRF